MASEDRGRPGADGDELRERLLGCFESLPRFHDLVFAILYGSQGPGGEPGPASDVDDGIVHENIRSRLDEVDGLVEPLRDAAGADDT